MTWRLRSTVTAKPLFNSPTGGATLGPVPGSEFHNNRKTHLHGGIDLNCNRIPLTPGRPGIILTAGLSTGLGGNKVEVDHGILQDGRRHVIKHYHFGHKHQPWQDCIYVRPGQQVHADTELGQAGDSGNASAVHDHYEHYIDGQAVDPLQYLREYQVVRKLLTGQHYALAYPGAEGPDIPYMQLRLTAHGFYCMADGVYGPKTVGQAKAFQTAKRLVPDGIVGRDTWRALIRRVML
jgi:hypothetical protein